MERLRDSSFTVYTHLRLVDGQHMWLVQIPTVPSVSVLLILGLNIGWKESQLTPYVPPGMGSCIFLAKLKSDDVGIHI